MLMWLANWSFLTETLLAGDVYLEGGRNTLDVKVLLLDSLPQPLNGVNNGGPRANPDDVAIVDMEINSLMGNITVSKTT